LQSLAAAARELGRELVVQEAATDVAIEAAFAAFAKAGAAGLIVQNDPFFDSRRKHIVALAASNRVPGIFHIREYAGKVLRGTKPDDLPVLRPTKFELVINTGTAKTLGLAVPQSMQIAADELIE
jgi:putative ABC transport system substrate-binding protein